MGRKDPAVALVNNGAEDTKGTPMYREAHGLLKANPAIRFVLVRFLRKAEITQLQTVLQNLDAEADKLRQDVYKRQALR